MSPLKIPNRSYTIRKISHEIKEEEDESLSDSSLEPSNRSQREPSNRSSKEPEFPKKQASVPAARLMINVEAFPEESQN